MPEDTDAPDDTDAPAPGAERPAETDWERRRRLARVFGDVLPETTSDERDDVRPAERESATDRWLKAQVPPHHGG